METTKSPRVHADKAAPHSGHGRVAAVVEGTGGSDASAIQAALNGLSSGRDWMEIVQLVGDFEIDATVSIPSYTNIDARGARLTAADSLNAAMFVNSDTSNGNFSISIQGGVFDGNKANQTSGHIFDFLRIGELWCRDAVLRRAKEQGCHGVNLYRAFFVGCVFDHCGSHGLYLEGTEGAQPGWVPDPAGDWGNPPVLSHSVLCNNEGAGVHVENVHDMVLGQNNIEDNEEQGIFYQGASANCIISDNNLERNGTQQIKLVSAGEASEFVIQCQDNGMSGRSNGSNLLELNADPGNARMVAYLDNNFIKQGDDNAGIYISAWRSDSHLKVTGGSIFTRNQDTTVGVEVATGAIVTRDRVRFENVQFFNQAIAFRVPGLIEPWVHACEFHDCGTVFDLGDSGNSRDIVVHERDNDFISNASILNARTSNSRRHTEVTTPTLSAAGRNADGATDRIDWSSPLDLTGSQAFTWASWVYFDSILADQYLWTVHNSANDARGVIFYFTSNDKLQLAILHATDNLTVAWSGAVETDQWHHVALVHDGSDDAGGAQLYVDGTKQGKAFNLDGAGSASDASGSWSLFGRIYDDNVNFDGAMVKTAAWNRKLFDDEIDRLVAGEKPTAIDTGLVWYPDLLRSLDDPMSGNAGTADGTNVEQFEAP